MRFAVDVILVCIPWYAAYPSCLLPTSFMHWQGKSVQFEGLALAPAKITFISGQCDTTID